MKTLISEKTQMIGKVIVFALGIFSISAKADQCPTPINKVAPELSSRVSYDQSTKLYHYDYTLKNGTSALLPIDHLVLYVKESPKAISAPQGWDHDFMTNEPSRIDWMDNMTIDKAGKPQHPYVLQPGKSLSGFSVTSTRSPGLVKFVAEGRLEFVPKSTAKPGIDEPVPNCPGFDFDGSGGEFAQNLLGMVEGPSDPNIITAKIKLKGEIEELLEHKDTKHPSYAEVIIFGDENINVSKIDVSSVRFGMGQAQALSSKSLPSDDDDKRDDKDNKDRNEKNTERSKNLLLRFDLSKIGVRCDLDLALFLTGTVGGKQFIGGTQIKKLKCKDGDKKSRHHRQDALELGD